MRKRLLWSLIALTCGVLGTGIWFASSVNSSYVVPPQEMQSWLKNIDMNVWEASDKSFYVQEAIGSQGIVLEYPKQLKNDFLLTFNIMSLTSEAEIRLGFGKKGKKYETEVKFSDRSNKLKFSKNKVLLLEKDIKQIQPDIFYNFELRRKNNIFVFAIDGNEVLKAETDHNPVSISLDIVGFPDNPAAVEIMDWIIKN